MAETSQANGNGHNGQTTAAGVTPDLAKQFALRALTSALNDRVAFFRQAGISFDGARDMYAVLGYPRVISIQQARERYARGGLAGRVVDVFPNATWRDDFEIREKDAEGQAAEGGKLTKFEQDWKALAARLGVSSRLRRADILSQIGYFAVLLIGAPGDLSQELPKGKSQEEIAYLDPYLGDSAPNNATAGLVRGSGGWPGSGLTTATATVKELESDAASPRFGQPKAYQLNRADVRSDVLARPVHWSRVVHFADGCLDNDVYGMPRLERVWNLLDDLDKVTGGGAEAFWLRANQGLHLDVDKEMTLSPEEKAALSTMADEYMHQMRRMLRTRGVSVETLGSDVANFGPQSDSIITQIAGALAVPKRILTGSEMGELASSQDRDNWRDQVVGRQNGHAGPNMLRRLVGRLIEYGYLTTPGGGPQAYEAVWPHAQALTETERADGAKNWAATNQTMGETVFTNEEIRRKWYQMEPLKPEQIQKVAGNQPGSPQGDPNQVQGRFAQAADSDLARALQDALVAGDKDAIDALLWGEASQ